ncbi:MAG TPA: HD domain-containing phosphohydrolase [Devosia sp.]|nr:HD domain-containing phosphohydrolase [Devosia sp.]
MRTPEKTVVLVHDADGRFGCERLAAELKFVAMPLSPAAAAAIDAARAVVVDVDLRDMAKIVTLRDVLARAPHRGPLLFAVDRGPAAHLATVQGNALGGRRAIHRPLSSDEVCAALAELDALPDSHGARPARASGGAGVASVNAAAAMIEGSFRALARGGMLDLQQTTDASHQLLAGVNQAGLETWLDTVRAHHDGTFQHCLLVTGAAAAWANQARLPEADRLTLTTAALLHDVGKAQVPREILDKPGKLSPDEMAIVRRHPLIGREYLSRQPGLREEVLAAVAHHHELLDGSGYPFGLRGTQIASLTQILTVCDIYGALVERRAYKPPKPPADALLILADMASRGQVDYRIVRTLGAALGVELRSDLMDIVKGSAPPLPRRAAP